MTFPQQGGASWLKVVRLVLIFVRQKLLRRGVGRKLVLIAIEVMPAGSKSPAADGSMRTSTCGRCGFGVSAPSLTRASTMPFSGAIERDSAIMPKLVKLVGPSSILAGALILVLHSICCSVLRMLESLLVCCYVCLHGKT